MRLRASLTCVSRVMDCTNSIFQCVCQAYSRLKLGFAAHLDSMSFFYFLFFGGSSSYHVLTLVLTLYHFNSTNLAMTHLQGSALRIHLPSNWGRLHIGLKYFLLPNNQNCFWIAISCLVTLWFCCFFVQFCFHVSLFVRFGFSNYINCNAAGCLDPSLLWRSSWSKHSLAKWTFPSTVIQL